MMILFFRQFADAIGKIERFTEILELIFFFQVMLIDDLPAVAQFLPEPGEIVSFEGWDAVLARHTFFLREFSHNKHRNTKTAERQFCQMAPALTDGGGRVS